MKKVVCSKTGMVWDVEDVKALKQLFRNFSNAEVAGNLGRTPKSVERKAAKLGLKKTKKYLKAIGRKV